MKRKIEKWKDRLEERETRFLLVQAIDVYELKCVGMEGEIDHLQPAFGLLLALLVSCIIHLLNSNLVTQIYY